MFMRIRSYRTLPFTKLEGPIMAHLQTNGFGHQWSEFEYLAPDYLISSPRLLPKLSLVGAKTAQRVATSQNRVACCAHYLGVAQTNENRDGLRKTLVNSPA